MSQPTGGSWNDGQGGSLGQNWGANTESGEAGSGQGSLGQNWGNASSEQGGAQPGHGSLGQGWDASGSSDAGAHTQQLGGEQSGSGHEQQAYGQSAYGQGSYGQQAQHDPNQQPYGAAAPQAGGYKAPKPAGEGIGALFSDLKFSRSLTQGLAQITYLAVVVWAVLNFLASTIYNFGSREVANGFTVKNMGTFDAVMHLFADVVWLVLVLAVARILLELAVNVAKIAARRRD